MNFCPDCQSMLILKTSTSYPIKFCNRCDKEFLPEDRDTMITSSFTDTDGYNMDSILKYAPYDLVNERVKYNCPTKNCGRKYLTKVFLDNVVWYVCDNCPIQLKGNQVDISIQ